MMEPLTPDLRQRAFQQYCDRLDSHGTGLRPTGLPLPYNELQAQIEAAPWRIPMAAMMVEDELTELTNDLNRWRGALRRWNAWIDVLDSYEEDIAWAIQWEFVEALAFECLFQPAAIRDRLAFVATNALHQARMSVELGRMDALIGDASQKRKARVLKRWECEKQLQGLAGRWSESAAFMKQLEAIDGPEYRQATANFRNRASHSIAPRLGVGFTHAVTREVAPFPEMIDRGDGTFEPEETPTKWCVAYSVGGLPPLQMRQCHALNLAEYERAAQAHAAYVLLLGQVLAEICART